MIDSPLLKRQRRRERNKALVDLNLVSLIDIFTILIFFLLANSTEVEVLPSTKAVQLPESTSTDSPKQAVVIVVNDQEITVQGIKVAAVPDVSKIDGDVIAPLKQELEQLSGRQLIGTDEKSGIKSVTIMGDKEIPYRLLRKVMVTCAQANYNEISFAVLKKKG
ncbi:MAG: biopolymer transporter ExbD [Gammaproteobacteria bacterium]|nr:biopolymer transporter ExbD [Gammaproteobacteria bacterium]